jgi:hypothetical protein
MIINNIFLVLLISFALAAITPDASAANIESNATSSSAAKISLAIPVVHIVKMPSEIKIKNYHPDLENTEIGYITILTNSPKWVIDSSVLNGNPIVKTIFMSYNESLKMNLEPNIINNEGNGINQEPFTISQQGSRSDIICTNYEPAILITSSPRI